MLPEQQHGVGPIRFRPIKVRGLRESQGRGSQSGHHQETAATLLPEQQNGLVLVEFRPIKAR